MTTPGRGPVRDAQDIDQRNKITGLWPSARAIFYGNKLVRSAMRFLRRSRRPRSRRAPIRLVAPPNVPLPNLSLPKVETLEPRLLMSGNPVNLDVDGDGQVDALTDGILITRYLASFTGDSLIDGALAPGATCTDPAEIVARLDTVESTLLDVDGDGEASALSDGILAIRYMVGFTGDQLTGGAISPTATRDATEIVEFLNANNPEINTPPDVTVELANDTGTPGDGLTTDPTVIGTVTDDGTISTVTLTVPQLGAGPFDITGELDGNGDFELTQAEIEALIGVGLPGRPLTFEIEAIDDGGAPGASSVDLTLINQGELGVLTESTQEIVAEQSVLVELGEHGGSRELTFDLNFMFDGTDDGTFEDILNVSLVDPNNIGTTILDRGIDGTSLLSLVGGAVEMLTGRVTFNGSQATIDVSGIDGFPYGLLLFQLINSDGDSGSMVEIGAVENVVDPQGLQQAANAPVAAGEPGGELDLASLAINGQIEPWLGNPRLDAVTGEYEFDLRLRNLGDATGRTLGVLFADLPDGVTIMNASGVDGNGDPYINFREAIPPGGLGSNSSTGRIRVALDNPDFNPLDLTPVVYSDDNVAPVFDAVGPLETMAGGYLEVQLSATDANGDDLMFAIANDPMDGGLPDVTLTTGGVLRITPAPGQEGSYTLNLVVTDGMLMDAQNVTLDVVADPVTTTRLSGWLLNTDEDPIAGVTVGVGGVETTTAADGSFILDFGMGMLPGQTLRIEGDTFAGPEVYPFVAEPLDLLLGREVFDSVNNVIGRPIYLPELDVANGTTIDPMQDMMVQQEIAPGEFAEVMVQAGTLMDTQGGMFDGVLSITEVPVDFTPAALPENLIPDTVVTIQPAEMDFTVPAPLNMPNRSGLEPGEMAELYSINPETGTFDLVGMGQVSDDGAMIETVSGGVRNSSWHFFARLLQALGIGPGSNPRNRGDGCDDCKKKAKATSEVELHSGELLEFHQLPTYQSQGLARGVTLHYDSGRADPRPIIHFGFDQVSANTPNQKLVAAVTVSRGNMSFDVPGATGFIPGVPQNANFWNVPAEGGSIDAGLQVDMRMMPTGRYDFVQQAGIMTLARQLITDGMGNTIGVILTANGQTMPSAGSFVHVNTVDSIFGAGWGIAGLTRIIENPDGSAMVIDGDGSETIYEAPGMEGDPYIPEPGDFAELIKNMDGSFTRTLPDQTTEEYDATGRLTSRTDRNGNATNFEYDGNGNIDTITDPVGLETTFGYSGGRVTTITDPAMRVTELQYDAAGNLMRIVDADTLARTFEYDSGHRMTGEIDKLGHHETVNYGFHGRVESALLKDGTELHYDPLQTQGVFRPGETLDPFDGTASAFVDEGPMAMFIDGNGNVLRQELTRSGFLAGGADAEGEQFTVNINDNLTNAVIDTRGNVTQFTYDENGNVLSSVGTDSEPRAVDAAIDHPGDMDIYRFTVDGVGREFYFDSLTDRDDIRWSLSDGISNIISNREFDRSDSFDINVNEFVIPLEAGDYELMVFGEGDATGDYAFRFFDLASGVPIGFGVDVQAVLDPGNNSQLYTFEANAGETFYFDMVENNINSGSWRVVDPSGSVIVDANPFSDGGRATVAFDGVYTVIVEGRVSEVARNDFTFAVHRVDETPVPIDLDTMINGDLDSGGDQDVYTFTLSDYTMVQFDSLTNDGNFRWTLEGPAGVPNVQNTGLLQDQSFNGEEANDFEPILPPGDYELTVFSQFGGTGNYSFQILDYTNAPLINADTMVSVALEQGIASTAYRLAADAGDTFDIVINNRTTLNPPTTVMRVIDPFGREIDTRFVPTTLPDGLMTVEFDVTGDYIIAFDGRLNSTQPDFFTFTAVDQGNTAPVPVVGTPLVLGDITSGAIDVSDEMDVFTFTLVDRALLHFDSLTDNSNLNWSLAGPQGSIVDSRGFTNQDVFGDVMNLPAGDYAVTIDAFGGSTPAYEFRLSDVDAESTDLNGMLGTQQMAMLVEGDDSKIYDFDATAGDRIFIDSIGFTGDANADYRLVDQFGNTLLTSAINNDEPGVFDPDVVLDQTGTYYFIVEGHRFDDGGPQVFTFNLHTYGAGVPQVINLETPQLINGSIDTPGERDVFTFTLDAFAFVSFDGQVFTDQVQWSLDGPNGSVRDRVDFDVSGPVANLGEIPEDLLRLDPGDYTLTINGRGDATQAYSFRLLDLDDATPIALNTPVAGVLNPGAERAWFKFDASAGDRVFLDSQGGSDQIVWELVLPNGDELLGDFNRFGNFNTPVNLDLNDEQADRTVELPVDGTYYIFVEGDDNAPVVQAFQFAIFEETVSTTPLTLGTPVAGSIDQPAEFDHYTFTLADDAIVHFDNMRNTAGVGFSLYRGWERILVREFNSQDFSFAPLSLGAADYTVVVNGEDGDSTGDYSFTLNELFSGPSVPLDSDEQAMLTSNETAMFTFDATAGDTIFFDVQGRTAGGSSPRWRVYDPQGGEVFHQVFSNDVGNRTLSMTGTYAMLFEGDLNQANPDTLSYRLSLVDESPQAIDPASGTEELFGNISQPGDVDLFSFSLAQTTRVFFDRITNNGNLRYALAGPSGIEFQNTNGPSPASRDLIAGDYEFRVSMNGDLTGAYQFNIVPEDSANLISITPGTPVMGQLNPGSASLAYGFNATAGDRFYFDRQAITGGSMNWVLVAPTGEELFNSGFNDVDTLEMPATGEYLLLTRGFISSDLAVTDYTFNVQPVNFAESVYVPNTLINGSIDDTGEEDIYTFTLAARSLIYVDSRTNNSSFRFDLSGPTGVIENNQSLQLSENAELPYDLMPGTYTLTIDANGDATGAYSLGVFNLTSGAFGNIADGVPMNGALNPGNQTDIVRLNATAGDMFDFDNTAFDGSTSERWRLIDPFGQEVFDDRMQDDQLGVTVPFTGQYTLLLEGAIGQGSNVNYTFQVDFLGNTPVVPQGTTIMPGDTIASDISVGGEQDFYNFTLATDSVIYFDSLLNTGAIKWELSGPGGTHVTNQQFSDVDDAVNPLFLRAGTYEILVEGNFGSSTGAYEFQLLDLEAAATAIDPMDFGQVETHLVAEGNNTIAFSFDLTAGETFYFDQVSYTGGSSAVWRLIDPVGNERFDTFISSSNDGGSVTVTNSGTHLLLIEGRNSDSGAKAAQFAIHPVDATPTPITTGMQISETIATPGDRDVYTFTLATSQAFMFIDRMTNNGALRYTVEGPAGTFFSDVGTPSFLEDLPAGDYTVMVSMSGASTGSYVFQMLTPQDSVDITAQFGNVIMGQLDPGSETDIYRFDATAGDRLFFDRLSGDSNGPDVWRLRAPNGDEIIDPGFNNDIDTLTLPTTGTYTLEIGGSLTTQDENAMSDYSFVIHSVNADVNPLMLNVPVDGTISVPGENDVYTFTVTDRMLAHFDAASPTDDPDLDWTLVGPTGTIVNDRSFNNGDFAFDPFVLGAGDYTLTIDGDGDFTGDYRFMLFDVFGGTPIEFEQTIAGELDPAGESDIFTIDLEVGDSIFVDFTVGGSNDRWRLFSPAHDELLELNLSTDGLVTVEHAGTYGLLVEGNRDLGVQPYEFSVYRKDATPVDLEVVTSIGDRAQYDLQFNVPTRLVSRVGGIVDRTLDANGNVLTSTEVVGAPGGGDDATTTFTYLPGGLIDTRTDALGIVTDYDYDALGRLTRVTEAMGMPDERITEYEYDDLRGNVSAIVDGNDHRTEFQYDVMNQLVTTTRPDPDGAGPLVSPVLTRDYDGNGNLTSTTDANGNVTTFVYDELDRLIEVIAPDPDGTGPLAAPQTFTEYDANGNIIRFTDANGNLTQYAYDQRDRLVEVIDALGNSVQTVYNDDGLVSQLIDARGNVSEFEYNGSGQRLSAMNALGEVTLTSYDADNRISSITDANGNTETYAYDARGNRIRRVDPLGNVTTFAYDSADRLVSTTDPRGNVTTFTYDNHYRVTSITDPDGNSRSLSYDAVGNVLSRTDERGETTLFEYDALDRLTLETDPLMNSVQYGYDANGNRTSVQDRRGNVTTFMYDALDRLVETVNAAMDSSFIAYDANGNLVSAIDEEGRETTFAYDGLDRLIEQTDAMGESVLYSYDADGNIMSITDRRGFATTFEYDAADRQVAVVDALSNRVEYGYDAVGNIVSVRDPLGNETQYAYDGLSRLVSVTNALMDVATFSYDEAGNVVARTDELGRTTRFAYDNLNRPVAVIDPLGNTAVTEYDEVGNIVRTVDPLGNESLRTYDELGRIVSAEDDDGNSYDYTYDESGNLLTATDRLGQTTTYTYDELNRVATEQDPLMNLVTYTYDKVGNLTMTDLPEGVSTSSVFDDLNRRLSYTDGDGNETTYTYDERGNLLTITDPEMNVTTYGYDELSRQVSETNELGLARMLAYDAAGNLTSLVDRRGLTQEFEFDALNRVTEERWLDDQQQLVRTIDLDYDAAGQLTQIADSDSTYNYTYDIAGRTTSVSNAGTPGAPSVTLNYTYDAAGNLTEIVDVVNGGNAGTTAYTYDALNRVTRATQTGTGVTDKRVDFAYNAEGQFDQIDRFADLAGSSLIARSQYTYDGEGKVDTLSHSDGMTPIFTFDYDYDNLGRLTQRATTGGDTTYTYDDSSQLLTATHTDGANPDESYAYDDNGNRTSSHLPGAAYTTNDDNRLISDGTFTYEYDAEGNRTKRIHNGTGAVTEYEFDHRNRLTRVTERAMDGGAATAMTEYIYDVFDRRIRVTVDPDGDGVMAATEDHFVYHLENVFLRANSQGDVTHRYLVGPARDQVLAEDRGGGDVTWSLSDQQQTAFVLLDHTGAVENTLTYDSFGNVINETNPAAEFLFLFTGQVYDDSTGLYHFKARWYDAATGRFISQDPLSFAAGDSNLYRYVGNEPTNFVDPAGLNKTRARQGAETDGEATLRQNQAILDFLQTLANRGNQAFSLAGYPGLYQKLARRAIGGKDFARNFTQAFNQSLAAQNRLDDAQDAFRGAQSQLRTALRGHATAQRGAAALEGVQDINQARNAARLGSNANLARQNLVNASGEIVDAARNLRNAENAAETANNVFRGGQNVAQNISSTTKALNNVGTVFGFATAAAGEILDPTATTTGGQIVNAAGVGTFNAIPQLALFNAISAGVDLGAEGIYYLFGIDCVPPPKIFDATFGSFVRSIVAIAEGERGLRNLVERSRRGELGLINQGLTGAGDAIANSRAGEAATDVAAVGINAVDDIGRFQTDILSAPFSSNPQRSIGRAFNRLSNSTTANTVRNFFGL